jgi:hypothetical protein
LVRFGGLAAIALLVLTACYTDVGVQTTSTAGSLAAATKALSTQAVPPKPPTQGGGGGNQQQPPKNGGGGGRGGSPPAGAKTPTRPSLKASPATTQGRTPVAPPSGSKTPIRPGTTPVVPGGTKPPPVRTMPPVTTGTVRTTQGVTQPAGATTPAGKPPPGVTVSTTTGSPATSSTEVTGSPAATGMLVITKHENFQNAIIPGACFALLSGNTSVAAACDGGDGDAIPEAGKIGLVVPPGAYTLHETTPPPGYLPAADIPVEIVAGTPTAIDVIDHLEVTTSASPSTTTETGASPSATTSGGVLIATIATQDGSAPPEGACLTLTGSTVYQVCDNQAGDVDPTPGSIEIDNLTPGDYALTAMPPAGYELVEAPTSVTVSASTLSPVTITLRGVATPTTGNGTPAEVPTTEGSPATEETATETPTTGASPSPVGNVIATFTDEGGTNPVSGACLHLTGPATYDACDNQKGDLDPTPGRIEIDGVAAGDYTVAVDAPSGYEPAGALPNSVHVDPDQFAQLTFPFRPAATTGMVRIDKFDADGTTPLGGACFDLTGNNGTYQACDDGNGDADATPGVIVIANVAAGDYTLHESQPPAGHEAGPDQAVHVDAGQTASVRVANGTPVAPATGTLVITKVVAAEGTPTVGGACFTVTGSAGNPVEQCDDAGTGTIRFENLAPGDYTVHESRTPNGYLAAPDQTATITAGTETPLTFVDQPSAPQTGSLAITVQDGQQQPVPGACFDLAGPQAVHACDDAENDANPAPGQLLVQNLPPGDYTVTESTVPAGYQGAAPQTVTVAAGAAPAPLTFVNAKAPAGVASTSPVVYADDAGRLWLLRPGDAQPTRLDSQDRPFDPSMGPVFSSDHTWVAFLVTDAKTPAANMVWEKIADLTTGGVDFTSIGTPRRIAWLPGHTDTLIVAAELPGGGTNVFFYRTDTSELGATLFAADQHPASVEAIVPAPTGALVAIQATAADGDTNTYIVNTADPAAPVTTNVGPNSGKDPDHFLAWSPAGDRLLLQSGTATPLLYIADANGTTTPLGTAPLFTGDPTKGTAPEWSSDGGWIAAFDNDPAAGGQLHLFDATGAAHCDPIPNVIAFDWSPTETRIWALVAPPNEAVRLVTIGTDCAQQDKAPIGAGVDNLLWAPNGSALALIDHTDAGVTVALLVGDQITPIDVASASVAITDVLGWSPGGEMLALYAGGPTVSLWVVTPGSATPVTVSGSTLPDGAKFVTKVWWG